MLYKGLIPLYRHVFTSVIVKYQVISSPMIHRVVLWILQVVLHVS